MSIYTKTGDGGTTALANGKRVSKSSSLIQAIGALDQLNATIGISVALLNHPVDKGQVAASNLTEVGRLLIKIQRQLFSLGAFLAQAKVEFDLAEWTADLEIQIDTFDQQLPNLNRFILPGGSILASFLHLARTQVRTLERELVDLQLKHQADILPYINRLSDLFFVLARLVNQRLGEKEVEV